MLNSSFEENVFALKYQKSKFNAYICGKIAKIESKMIFKFRLRNVFSFRDEITLDLQAAKIQTEKGKALSGNLFTTNGVQVLKSISMFGANASGKSNVIKGIKACVNMIRHKNKKSRQKEMGRWVGKGGKQHKFLQNRRKRCFFFCVLPVFLYFCRLYEHYYLFIAYLRPCTQPAVGFVAWH